MRGELDGALDKMARLEELRRRQAAESAAHGQDSVRALAEAVRRVVAQHPGISVSLLMEEGQIARPMHVAWSGDAVEVSIGEPSALPVYAAPAGDAPPFTFADQSGLAAGPPPPDAASPSADTGSPASGAPAPPAWPMSVHTISSWTAANQISDGSAAQLAEMIRRDPTLLDRLDRR